ncbi:MAG: hypothetical protein PVF68_10550 [Acidobacteriota bacterium]
MGRKLPGLRLRVFGWPETWRVIPEPCDDGYRFHVRLERGSPGRATPPFLERTEWRAPELRGGLAAVKEEIRERAALARKRAFLVDETEEDI